MAKRAPVSFGDTDENADWILTPEQRKEEMAICDELLAKRKKAAGFEWTLEVQNVPAEASKGGPGSGNWRHTGLDRIHGGSDPGGGIGDVVSYNDQQYKEADSEMRAHYADWEAGLSQDQWDGIDWYSGSGYGVVNRILRGKKNYAVPDMVNDAKKYAPELDKAIDQARLPFSTLVHRGMCSDTKSNCYQQYSTLQPGDEFDDKGFISTSIIAEEARPWSGIVCHITLPKGSKAAYIEGVSGIGEMEILLGRGSRFRVTGRRQEGTTIPRLHLDLVLMAPEELPPLPWESGTEQKQAGDGNAPREDRSDKFVWELGDIEIFKGGQKGSARSGNWAHTGLAGQHGGSDAGGGVGKIQYVAHGATVDETHSIGAKLGYGKYDGGWASTLSGDENTAIYNYTSGGWIAMNGIMRGNCEKNGCGSQEDQRKAYRDFRHLDTALARGKLKKSIEVFRGLCSSQDCVEEMWDLEPGDELEDKGYTSTSLRYYGVLPKRIYVNITIPKGSPGAYLGRRSSHQDETEFLLPRGAKFRITGKRIKDGVKFLDATLLSYGADGPPILPDMGDFFDQFFTDKKAKGGEDRDRYFTWEAGDIVITKQGGKPTKASKGITGGYEWTLELVPGSDTKGGPGSGHHGHAGRPGKRGGSLPGKGGGGAAGQAMKPANPDGRDTMGQYRLADGSWTPERQALHERIKAHFFKGKTPVKNPESFIMGGGSAAGKSTLLREGFVTIPENHVLSNADDIKKLLPEYEGKGASFVHEESSWLAKQIAREAAAGSYNVLMDGTGDSSIDSITKKIRSMQPGGTRPIHGIYVTVDTDTAVARSMSRAERTGRYVPESVIRANHAGVSRVFPLLEHRDLFSSLRLFDTNAGTKLIAEEIDGKLRIYDEPAYKRFLAKAEG